MVKSDTATRSRTEALAALALVIVAGGRDVHFPWLASECRRRSPRFSERTTRAAEISSIFAT